MAALRDLTAAEIAASTRIPQYNVGPYSAANPYGFDDNGHRVNQMPQARDTMTMGLLARDMAIAARDFAEEVKAAAVLIAGGPVSSFTFNGVTQTGAVNFTTDEISEAVAADIEALRVSVAADIENARLDAMAFALAFGD